MGKRERKPVHDWHGQRVAPGTARDITFAIGESYSGSPLEIPIRVCRAKQDGPIVFVTAALHGDELNGAGAIRQLIQDDAFRLLRGSVILVPVLNLVSFDRHDRYLPDRRDLNRCFPGSTDGSMASRVARRIFDEIVARSDYGIDLHTASIRRTNYPTVRADMAHTRVNEMAKAFGGELIVDGAGPRGALRREATRVGCPTIVMEGGEVWKVEPTIVESAVRGIKNFLGHLEMIDHPTDRPEYQVVVKKSKWIRAEHGGFLQFHIRPGQVVDKGQPLATNTNLLGHEHTVSHAPFHAVVLGMTTLPAISPGEPICHLGKLPRSRKPSDLRRLRSDEQGLERRVVDQLGSNVMIVEPTDDE